MKQPIRAVLFDMDGVLLDTEPLGRIVLDEALAVQQIHLNQEQWHQFIGINMQTTRRLLKEWFGDAVDPDRYDRDWKRLMLEHLHRDGMPMKPHADETLRRLQAAGIRLALCTSNATEIVSEYLAMAGWGGCFDAVITGDQVRHGKPSPEIYLRGAEAVQQPVEACIGVEDSINGLKSLKAAQVSSVMIPDTFPYSESLAPLVDHCFVNLRDMTDFILKE